MGLKDLTGKSETIDTFSLVPLNPSDSRWRNMMCRYIPFAALCLAATAAQAGELAPYQATSIALGSIRGVAYYTEAPGGDRVVTTLADGEAGLPVRFEVTLSENQSLTISVPGKLGEPGQALEISRAGDKLVVSTPQGATEGLAVMGPPAVGD
jgi:hypothetical protein